jgi:hypothetical protein
MKPASVLKIAAFVAVIIAPLTALAVHGAILPYGQKPFAGFPTLAAVSGGEKGALDKFGEALLDRSPVTEAAIRLKNFVAYHGANFIDTDSIIFGRGGWLFYKEELICVDRAKLSAALNHIDEMIDTAKAAGIELIVSISPDKASIYPEELHPLAKPYWACKLENNRLWRTLLAQHPKIIDHAIPILAEKQRDPRGKLYFVTDTHWTPFGSVWALRQLIGAAGRYEYSKLPPPVRAGGMLARPTDMANTMLLLPGMEDYDKVDSSIENKLSVLADVPERRTVILHDSFYNVIMEWLLPNFPGAAAFHVDGDIAKYPAALTSADRIIVNSVERAFLGRSIDGGTLSWTGPLGRAILARSADNARRASQ